MTITRADSPTRNTGATVADGRNNRQRGWVATVVALASVAMFAAVAGEVLGNILAGTATHRDPILAVALLLNIALILIGWRHDREVKEEIANHSDAARRANALATKDPLTGLHNRRSAGEIGSQMLAETERRQMALAMLVADLDGFKHVNDVHGHHAGDELLKIVAEKMQRILPQSALIARLGGDEFAMAFAFEPSGASTVNAIADDLIEAIGRPIPIDEQTVQISVSIGIARSDHDCETVETLMRRGDIAMYAAKNQGKSRSVWFDKTMERELQIRNKVEAGLRTGIPKGEVVPYYEPQIDIATGRLHGFEVLARWVHPSEGVVEPEVFIHVAEEAGLIADLSESVMRQAFIETRSWDPELVLSVNISPTQLKDPWLSQKIIKLLTETNFPANRLEVEITETALFDNLGIANSIIASLKNQGIRIALDDFGTGYSSLSHLRSLPFDRIKIDRSFVSSITQDNESAAIVDAIARLSGSLGLPVTAEGVENSEIEEALKKVGAMHGQGWLFGKPMPIQDIRRLLAERDMIVPRSREEKAEEALQQIRQIRGTG
ncbi:MAG: EAL domain-containing protein [Parasphingopyxis sp.]|uniref:putative bifunctional diguanylate cyclase/phosphodiesterase n=1 Tax=Parasphingopyxis sp. TaxID=1920299 RepID=UPI0026316EB2|nr:EAL domain-containing protein [uncultured Parasphingopyxis sp.]